MLTVDAKDCKGSEEEEEEMYLRFASSASLRHAFHFSTLKEMDALLATIRNHAY